MIAMRTVPVVADEADSVIGKPLGKSKPLLLAILQASIGSWPAIGGVGGAVGVGVGEGVGVGVAEPSVGVAVGDTTETSGSPGIRMKPAR